MTDPSRFQRRVIVTGGAGFIGSNLLLLLVCKYPQYLFVNVDVLTYAGNASNLREIEGSDNYRFERIDICDLPALRSCFEKYNPDGVIHLAAESHVDRSIDGPSPFIQTNIVGTFNLLQLALAARDHGVNVRFHHVSTDEVYGSLGSSGSFGEDSPYAPNSPYSASKASGDHLVRAFRRTYDLDVVITNCSNNYGPYQFPEKLIPLVINNARLGKSLPIYGDGRHVRDWLYVEDHCHALDLVFHQGTPGRCYNIGARNEIANVDLVRRLCRLLDRRLGGGPREKLIEFVADRPGHDRRYAIDSSRIEQELNWRPRYSLGDGLECTVDWYLSHEQWLADCTSGQYRQYYQKMYGDR